MLPAQQGRPMQSVWIAFNAIIIARFPLLKSMKKPPLMLYSSYKAVPSFKYSRSARPAERRIYGKKDRSHRLSSRMGVHVQRRIKKD